MWMLDRASRQNEKRAQRFDIFARFYRDGSLERRGLEAVRRLQEDIAILHRTTGVSGTGITTPNDTERDLAMIVAGQRIETVKRQTGGHSWAILMALSAARRDLNGEVREWWALVQAVTREAHRNAQAALVRGGHEPCRRLRLARGGQTCRLTFYRNNVPAMRRFAPGRLIVRNPSRPANTQHQARTGH